MPTIPTATRFVYDGDGGRVKTITPQGTTRFLGDVVEIAPSGLMTQYLFVGGQRIAALDRSPQAVASNSELRSSPSRLARWWQQTLHALATFLDLPLAEAALPPSAIRFYHGDHLGSTNLITDGSGTVVEHVEYTPYGSVSFASSPQPSAPSPFKFTGQRLDASTGLYFYHARYYDPALGRFIQADPVVPVPGDPQALNRYSYVRNNPLTYTDPSGHGWRQIFGWVSTALSILLPPLAPVLMAANIGLGLYDAAKTGNWLGFVGSTVGSLVGGAVFGAIGKDIGLGITTAMGSGVLGGGVAGFIGGAISGAAEFGLAGFGSGFGGALGGGASVREALHAGGLSAAISGGLGAGIQGSYLGGLQGTLHGKSIEQIAGAQGYTLVPMGGSMGPLDPPGVGTASATATRQEMGNIHPARLFKWGVGINKAVKLNHLQAAGVLSANDLSNGVYANWMSDARISAQLVSGRAPELHNPLSHGQGRPGYYWHYHPLTVDGQKMDSHAWFGSPTQ